jgi:NAD(P)-dependent dehydrogenase (short-subunit alcohol dehydrogenase family)
MSDALQGMSTLVTGGGSGIGRGVVDAYVAAGALVTVVERSTDNAEGLLRDYAGNVTVVVGDATDPGVLDDAVGAAQRGASQLDNLTCCVGVFDYYASVRELDAQQLLAASAEIWRLNVASTLLAVNRAYPSLRSARGSITLTLSESAFRGVGGGVLYGSSKWALRGAVSHLAADLAPDVRVNAVAPGGTEGTRLGGLSTLGHTRTADQIPGRADRIKSSNLLQVVAEPHDHAAAYVYLASRGARVCTGVVINTDGSGQ